VHTFAHVGRMLRHHDTVALIQIKHGFFACKGTATTEKPQHGIFRMVTENHRPTVIMDAFGDE
ncbi:MAG: hypothetical protein IJ160_04495, partial [Muribaculaceae bacterium]|nr:hypothetical protein [Muribaculaceae bacterium]